MATTAKTVPNDDLSTLAWVADEVRRSLESAHKNLRRYLRESEAVSGSDLDGVDATTLRQVRAQIHQSVGALELVGMGVAAHPLRAAEAVVQRMASKRSLASAGTLQAIEQGSFAVLDFLARRLAGKKVSPLSLFPQYRALQELAGAARVHPADLWPIDFQWIGVPALSVDAPLAAHAADGGSVDRFESEMLGALRGKPGALGRLSQLCSSLGVGSQGHLATLWCLASAFLEGVEAGQIRFDVHAKRVASRLLAQLRAGDGGQASERLAQDLLFFCGQARVSAECPAGPRLADVRQAYSLAEEEPVDYETAALGRFDPATVALARKRLAAAKEVWSAVAGGELARLPGLAEPFALVGDSLNRLYPVGNQLTQALQAAVQACVTSGAEPAAPMAMEVATALLYVEASLEDLDFDHPEMAQRVERLAQRLDDVRQGKPPGALEIWMEDLYRRVSDRQTMGNVVQELRAALSEVEKQIDQYFRNPSDRSLLIPVPQQLSAMRGVLSLLDLDHASQAVLRMRDDVDALATTEVDPERAIQAGTFDRLADNLGALSFLIDMVSVQPQMARSLFHFDPEAGQLKAAMTLADRPSGFAALDSGEAEKPQLVEQAQQIARVATDSEADLQSLGRDLERLSQQARAADHQALAEVVNKAQSTLANADGTEAEDQARRQLAESIHEFVQSTQEPVGLEPLEPPRPIPPAGPPAAPGQTGLEDDAEMREIFLEEAREVIAGALEGLTELREQPADLAAMTVVRRAFHTLKGSSRMVGLKDFGEAAWACEQLYNARLAESAPADSDLRGFTHDALDYFDRWVSAIEAGDVSAFGPQPVIESADALRLEGRRVALATATEAPRVEQALPPSMPAGPAVGSDPSAGLPAASGDVIETVPVSAEAAPPAAPGDAPEFDLILEPASRGGVEVPRFAPGAPDEALDRAAWADETLPFGRMTGPHPPDASASIPLLTDRVKGLPDSADLDLTLDLSSTAPMPGPVQGPELAQGLIELPDLGEAPFGQAATPAERVAAEAPSPAIGAFDLDFDLDLGAPSAPTSGDGADEAPGAAQAPDAQAGPGDLQPTQGAQVEPEFSLDLDALDLSLAAPTGVEPAEPPPVPSSWAPAPEVVESVEAVELGPEAWDALQLGPAPGPVAAFPVTQIEPRPGTPRAVADDETLRLTDVSALLSGADSDASLATIESPAAARQDDEDATLPLAHDPVHDPVPAAPTSHARPDDGDDSNHADADADDEQTKVIGDLRVSIPLFNIYLNEADELSRRLSTELAEWRHELHRPAGDTPVALAHSLAGSSGTVGFAALSQLARSLEHALMRSNARVEGREADAELFGRAAEDIRRLLHQFAAGFLREPDGEVLRGLAEIEHAPAPMADVLTAADALDAADAAEVLDVADEADVAAAADATDVLEASDASDVLAAAGAADVIDVAGLADPDEVVGLVEAEQPLPGSAVVDEPAPVTTEDDSLPALSTSSAVPAEVEEVFGQVGMPALTSFEALSETSVHRPGAARPAESAGVDDDIDAIDAVDAELFDIFAEEGGELIPQLQARLRDWAARPDDSTAASGCMRTLHTLKGSARLAGAMRLGEMAHRLESAVEQLLAAGTATPADIDRLVSHADDLEARFQSLHGGETEVPAASALAASVAGVQAAGADLGTSAPVLVTAAPPAASEPEPDAPATVGPELPSRRVNAGIEWSRFVSGATPSDGIDAAPASQPAASGAAVRVRAPLLDRLVNHAGEVSITRARIEADMGQMKGAVGDLTENLERLRAQLRDIELQAETQIGTRLEAARAAALQFDPLEMDRFTRFQELTRMMAESVNDVATVQRGLQRTLQSAEDDLAQQARLTRDLQDDLLRTRMVEFDSLSERLYRVVRQAAKETGKQVRLDINGGTIEIDRGVLDRMTGAFEHLLRNAVVHGIESPADRAVLGKNGVGTITMAVSQEGNEVAVDVRDDGGGLHLQRIRDRAVAMGRLAADSQPTEAELAALIFQSGFSTADQVTGLAGRGVGMDVVRADVNAMGGRIETATAEGRGTSFKLVLPLTTAVTQVVLMRCAGLTVAVPSALIEIVRRLPSGQLQALYERGTYPHGDAELPFYWLGSLLQGTPFGASSGRTVPVVVIRSAAQRIVLHVDEVLGNQEVVVKHLGPQLSRLPGLAGMTLLPSGAPALIYNPVALAALYGQGARAATLAALSAERQRVAEHRDAVEPLAPLVLVVDDSLTVRRVTQRLLAREGYRVAVAKDGLEGLEMLADELPVAVLTDIEMPRMDGFDLVRNMRADARLARLPVIMITSRIAQKHRDYAMELGVQHYLGKPYVEDDLLALVAGFAGRVPAH